MEVCIVVRFVFMSCSVRVSGFVPMFVVYLVLLNAVCLLSLGVGLCIVSLSVVWADCTTALYVVLSVSFCLTHGVAFSTFMICSAFVAMLAVCALYVSLGS